MLCNYTTSPPLTLNLDVCGAQATVTIQLSALSLGITGPVKVRDVWNKQDLPLATTGAVTTSVPHHGSVFLVFMPPTSAWSACFVTCAPRPFSSRRCLCGTWLGFVNGTV